MTRTSRVSPSYAPDKTSGTQLVNAENLGANGPVVQKLHPNENRDIKTAVKKCNTSTGRLTHLKNYKTGIRTVRTPILETEANTGTSSNPLSVLTSIGTPSQKHHKQ
jgi:hypothetical protein